METRDHPLEFRWITRPCYCRSCCQREAPHRETAHYTESCCPLTLKEQAALTNIILRRAQ